VVAAIDRRVKSVVGQVPFISGSRQHQEMVQDFPHRMAERD
jgi:cephalosporin-C deacetylase-like acetyl esterase